MEAKAGHIAISPFYSRPEDVNPPVSTYILSGGSRVIVVDPGPLWHLQMHMEDMRRIISQTSELIVVIQSPGPGVFGGLTRLREFGRRHVLVVHWKSTIVAGQDFEGWTVRSLATRTAGLPITPAAKLTIGISPFGASPGSLMSFERSTGTLFAGPFLGSLGPGLQSGQPVLRRESVRAYRETMTPFMPPDIVDRVFGTDITINQIAPSYGRMATGGNSLIQSIFRDDPDGPPLAIALSRLFVRAAALIGEEAARGVFRAATLPVPRIESGYPVLTGTEVAELTADDWRRALTALERWMPGPALTALLPVVAEMAAQYDLPIDRIAGRYSRAATTVFAGPAAGFPAPYDPRTVNMSAAARTGSRDGAHETAGGELTDTATGLMNETVFKQRLVGQMREESTPGRQGSVILLGVDNIRRINSTYGRGGGDDALYTIAYLLRNFQAAYSRRGSHRLYKLNGPHFAYVLAEGDLAEGADVAEKLRRVVSESAMFLEQLTVSIGVVGLDEVRLTPGDESEDVLAGVATSRAFARLRIAQQGGANSVCSTDPVGVSSVSSGSTVLIADPDAPYLEMLKKVLEDQSYTVLIAKDGGEARTIIEQIVPDVIVAEVMLPKLNGFALREQLRHDARLSQIPFVLVSHRKGDEAVEKAGLLGIVHFLAKPFSMTELTGLLRNLTRRSGHALEPA
jgi:diguanylate cyclase (GGDEF)-like protein